MSFYSTLSLYECLSDSVIQIMSLGFSECVSVYLFVFLYVSECKDNVYLVESVLIGVGQKGELYRGTTVSEFFY